MLTKLFGNLDWRHWVLSHLVWIVAVVIALVMGRSFIAEHDARILADAQIKTSEATVATLQQQIAAANAAATQKTQTIVKIVHDAVTPAQQIAAIPQLSNVPLNERAVPGSPTQVTVDLAPLVQELGQCKQDSVQLAACQIDLKATQGIVDQKQNEIAALKKKPAFWKRVKKTLELIGLCVGIGAALGAHL